MNKIRKETRGRRPSFFNENGVDQLVTMMMELMAELWVVKERLYMVERVAAEDGIALTEKIEAYRPSPDEVKTLEETRRGFVESIMRTLETDFTDRASVQDEIDRLTEEMKQG